MFEKSLPKVVTSIQPKSIAEIYGEGNTHLSEMLENSVGVYSPAFEYAETQREALKKIKNKKSQEYAELGAHIACVDFWVTERQEKWYKDLSEYVLKRAKAIGYTVDETSLEDILPYLVDGRYMESVYHRYSVQEFTDMVIRSFAENVQEIDVTMLHILKLIQ